MRTIIGLRDPEALAPDIVGYKFFSLAQANRAGYPVPPAVVLTTHVHHHFLKHADWPPGVFERVLEAARKLNLQKGLSIRSSAIREDLERQSFAGQYRTFLEVAGQEDLKLKIEQCWRGVDAESVRSYLKTFGSAGGEGELPLMGVILQKMVDASAAGVAFSRNPMHPYRDETVIEGVPGYADKLVSGHVSPHRAFIAGSETIRVEPPGRGGKRLLSNDQWLSVASLARGLEKHHGGRPRDIEWAFDRGGALWLLQSRSITAFSDREKEIPPGCWTRRIVEDLWADRLTPFMASAMLRHMHRFDMSRMLKLLGVSSVSSPLSVIDGYLYVNVEGIAKLARCFPSCLRFPEIRAFFPPGFPVEELPRPRWREILPVAARAPLVLIKEPGIIPFFTFRISRGHQDRIEARLNHLDLMPADTPDAVLRKIEIGLDTVALIQETNQWPYGHANFFTLALRRWIVNCLGLSHSVFLEFISRNNDNVTIRIERSLRCIAAKIMSDGYLRAAFLHRPSHELAADIPAAIREDIRSFLRQFGCRSRHRSLYLKRWAEDPEEIIGILQSLVRHGRSDSCTGMTGTEGLKRNPVDSGNSWRDIHWSLRSVSRAFARMTVRFLDLRENLRFLLDKALFRLRGALLDLGHLTGLEDGVLFLSVSEVEHLVSEDLSLTEARALIARRKKDFFNSAEPPPFYREGVPVDDIASGEVRFLQGIGTSSGRASGRARIVEVPARSDIAEGDILVARNTDPGWTPVLSIVGGMIMEEGGLLNHCSIVARELKVPSVVGVRDATRKIPDGAIVHIDGGTGMIRIEAPKFAVRKKPHAKRAKKI